MQHASGDPYLPLDDTADAARLLSETTGQDHGPELRDTYGRPRLVLMVKDPYSLFAYWEWLTWDHPPIGREGGVGHQALENGRRPLWLRVYETNADGRALVALPERHRVAETGRYHLRVPHGGRHYIARLEDGDGNPLLTSNIVATPPGRPSEYSQADWLTRAAFSHWFNFFGGGPTSPGLSATIEGLWQAMDLGSSPMPQSRPPRLLQDLDVRVIVSGKTKPGVAVTALGAPVPVGPDGSFTVETELPGERLTLALRLEPDTEDGGGWEAAVVSIERRPGPYSRGGSFSKSQQAAEEVMRNHESPD